MDNEIMTENKLLGKTFFWMFLGILGSAIVAWYTYSSGLFLQLATEGTFGIVLIVELVVVLLFSFLFRKLPPVVVGILYFVYSMVNGVTLSTIFYAYELDSIIYLFGLSALIFAALAFIGYKTEADLTSWRPYITVFLIAGIVMSLINLFLKNSMFDLIIDWFVLALFCGVTIYDLNKVKMLESEVEAGDEKLHIYCAMQLYLDFVNIFIRILSIFGKRRD
ncbi:MAG: Bax inhibitor-1/YccA family protein [Clostridia bacterium]|nr:Bax inhibitor-1/YccA family protein [Clostridia bacterium]